MESNPKEYTFFEHLDEFKDCLTKSVLAVILSSCLIYSFIDHIMAFLIRPVGRLVFTAPAEAFVAQMYLTFFCGFLVSLPYVLYQVWQFVSSGLRPHERKYISLYGPLSLMCFLLGSIFAYFVMIPISLQFLLSFSSDHIVPMITVQKYISFLGSMVLSFGVVFELPLILMFLTRIGIATPAFLIQKRRHAVVLIMIVSAILTPPDVVTLLLMSIPLIVLYEIGILISSITYRSKEI